MVVKRPGRSALLAALNAAMRKASAQGVLYSATVAARLKLASSDLECLDIVVLEGAVTAGRLAAATGLTTGAITGVIDRLERAGFARRERDAVDRRKVLVRAEPAALRRIAPLYVPMQRAGEESLAPYSEPELALLLGFLERAAAAAVAATAELRDTALHDTTPPPADTKADAKADTQAARRRGARRAD
jgi:DNA-binding MarR family transcriptional regulator